MLDEDMMNEIIGFVLEEIMMPRQLPVVLEVILKIRRQVGPN